MINKSVTLASFDDRLAARAMDGLIILPIAVGIFMVLLLKLFPTISLESVVQNNNPALENGLTLANICLSIFTSVYFIYFTAIQSATPGKKILKLAVISQKEGKLTLWQIITRETWAKFLSGIFYLGYIWMLLDKNNQTWHDKLAGTVVLRYGDNRRTKKVIFGVTALLLGIWLIIGIFIIRSVIKDMNTKQLLLPKQFLEQLLPPTPPPLVT